MASLVFNTETGRKGRPMSRHVNKGKNIHTRKLSARRSRDPKAPASSIGPTELGKGRSPRLGAKGRARKSRSGGGTWGEVT